MISGPVASTPSFTQITSLFGDLASGKIYARRSNVAQSGQPTYAVNLINSDGQPTTLASLTGGRRIRASFCSPMAPPAYCSSGTGDFYRMTQVSTLRRALLHLGHGGRATCSRLIDVVAVSALNDLSNAHPDYFFWDGRSERETTVKSWNRVFRKMFRSAKPPIEGGHPHRFRDTFAVSLLLKGVELTHVSILLGHASIKITERHYAPDSSEGKNRHSHRARPTTDSTLVMRGVSP